MSFHDQLFDYVRKAHDHAEDLIEELIGEHKAHCELETFHMSTTNCIAVLYDHGVDYAKAETHHYIDTMRFISWCERRS